MKNKRRKSETSETSSEENGGARIASNNANDGETRSKNNNDAESPARKSPSKRRSMRSVPMQKPAHADDDIEMKDDSVEAPESERENGEKVAGRKSVLDKRRKKVDRKASTSANDKPNRENEYEVCLRLCCYPPSNVSVRQDISFLHMSVYVTSLTSSIVTSPSDQRRQWTSDQVKPTKRFNRFRRNVFCFIVYFFSSCLLLLLFLLLHYF